MGSLIAFSLVVVCVAALIALLPCVFLSRLFPHWKQWLIIALSAVLFPSILAAFSVHLFLRGSETAQQGGGIDPGQLDMWFGEMGLFLALFSLLAGLISTRYLMRRRGRA